MWDMLTQQWWDMLTQRWWYMLTQRWLYVDAAMFIHVYAAIVICCCSYGFILTQWWWYMSTTYAWYHDPLTERFIDRQTWDWQKHFFSLETCFSTSVNFFLLVSDGSCCDVVLLFSLIIFPFINYICPHLGNSYFTPCALREALNDKKYTNYSKVSYCGQGPLP